jgi:hypothetical protein
MRILASALTIAALSLSPALAGAQPQTTVITTPSDDTIDAWNAQVFASGASVFLASYGAAVITAASTSTEANQRLYVPLVGPWLDLGDRSSCDLLHPNCDHETTDKVLLAVDGVFQAAGVLTMLDGLIFPSHHTVIRTAERDRVRVLPTTLSAVDGAAPGFTVMGRW